MPLLKVSAFSSRQLQAVILAMQNIDREIAKEIRRHTKTMIAPVWQQAVREHASTRLEQRVLASTAKVAVSNQNVTLKSAQSVRKLSGGLVPAHHYSGVEFGVDDRETTYTATSKRGKRYKVTRTTTHQLRVRNPRGYAVFPSAAEVIPRLAALWVQTVVRTFHEAAEKR